MPVLPTGIMDTQGCSWLSCCTAQALPYLSTKPSDVCVRMEMHRNKSNTSVLPRTRVHELLISFRTVLIETSCLTQPSPSPSPSFTFRNHFLLFPAGHAVLLPALKQIFCWVWLLPQPHVIFCLIFYPSAAEENIWGWKSPKAFEVLR